MALQAMVNGTLSGFNVQMTLRKFGSRIGGGTMSVEQNKATLRRIYDEVWNRGDTSVIPELVSPGFFTRGLHKDLAGHEGYKEMVAKLRADMPDVHFTIDEVVGEGDNLVYRITGEGTYKGEKYRWTQAIFTSYAEGRVAEALSISERLPWQQPLGILPPSYELAEK